MCEALAKPKKMTPPAPQVKNDQKLQDQAPYANDPSAATRNLMNAANKDMASLS
jgi:hypothetical protein